MNLSIAATAALANAGMTAGELQYLRQIAGNISNKKRKTTKAKKAKKLKRNKAAKQARKRNR
jgi:hypothetical protein